MDRKKKKISGKKKVMVSFFGGLTLTTTRLKTQPIFSKVSALPGIAKLRANTLLILETITNTYYLFQIQ